MSVTSALKYFSNANPPSEICLRTPTKAAPRRNPTHILRDIVEDGSGEPLMRVCGSLLMPKSVATTLLYPETPCNDPRIFALAGIYELGCFDCSMVEAGEVSGLFHLAYDCKIYSLCKEMVKNVCPNFSDWVKMMSLIHSKCSSNDYLNLSNCLQPLFQKPSFIKSFEAGDFHHVCLDVVVRSIECYKFSPSYKLIQHQYCKIICGWLAL
mmetsp:Transcript_16853/g.33218  ORF Transcript_16853/g.33218 Transcript_16853/m.33218 type:complete len:210 (-) Transcript_16853:653-1282(-)